MYRLTLFILLIAAFLVGCGGGGIQRDDSGVVVEAGEVSAFDIQVGDCFNDPSGDDQLVSTLAVVPCSEPHDNEVYHKVNYPAGAEAPFPAQEELDSFSDQQCESAFEGYVGIAYASSRLVVAPLQPTEDSWADDDREIICILFDPDLNKLEGSQRGAAQ